MNDITQWLGAASRGDSAALGQVFDHLYPELRRMAQHRIAAGEQTLTPTVLVHEAYLRLVGSAQLSLSDRRHFLACAARVMRAIVVDNARHRSAEKRGGGARPLTIDELTAPPAMNDRPEDLIALDEALDRLDAINPRLREVVELRCFGGLMLGEIGDLLGCSLRTVERDWARARALVAAQWQPG